MIRVALSAEPSGFDSAVRQKGLSAIDELVGRPPRLSHGGPKRIKVAARESDIPPDRFPPYWRDALPDMRKSYGCLCSFLALYLEHATGGSSVDHMLPKSKHWDKVYEWSNYRLCAATINARKRDLSGVLDPVDCNSGWFALELVGFQVIAGDRAPKRKIAVINDTLVLLNTSDCCKAREEYVTSYWTGEITLGYLERRAPFIAAELRRQNRLTAG